MDQPLHLTMEGTNPLAMSEWLTGPSLPLGGNFDLENMKLLPKVFKLHSGQWLSQHISYLFVCRNILELHCSSLHHIADIVCNVPDPLTGEEDATKQTKTSGQKSP